MKVSFHYTPLGKVTAPRAGWPESFAHPADWNGETGHSKSSTNEGRQRRRHGSHSLPIALGVHRGLCKRGSYTFAASKEAASVIWLPSSIDEVWFGDEAVCYRRGMKSGQYYGGCAECSLIFSQKKSAYDRPQHLGSLHIE